MYPMTNEQMSLMVQTMSEAWDGAATEHPSISSLFDENAPYLTIWDNNRFLPATEQQPFLFATEQQAIDSIATASTTILHWLSTLADLIQEHKATDIYIEHARKSGTEKNKSGLTEEERIIKEEKKRVAQQRYGCQPSTSSGSNTWQAPAQSQWHGDNWQTHAQGQWHGDNWQSQWQRDNWQTHGSGSSSYYCFQTDF